MAQASATKSRAKPKRSPWNIVGRIAYGTLVAVSVIVVTLFIVYSIVVRPPEAIAPEIIPPMPVVDDPDTEINESEMIPAMPEGIQRRPGVHTFLLAGVDDGNGNADTIMVMTYDVPNGTIGVVSIPRDTLVNVSRAVKKINAAYGSGGEEQLVQEAASLLGIPIDHYIRVNISAFKAIVNAVNGVDFYVPQDMYHNDGAGFIINLKKGQQPLNGDQALQLVRYRGYGDADIGRIHTQQAFLTAMAKKVLSWSSLTKVNSFVDIFAKHVKTDLSVGNLAYFAIEAMSVDTSNGVKFATLPGDGSVTYKGIEWYYQLYPDEVLQIVNDVLNPYDADITAEMMNILQVK